MRTAKLPKKRDKEAGRFRVSEVEIIKTYRDGYHFIGVTCYECNKTANVVAFGASWKCYCGHESLLHWRYANLPPHNKPDLGPTLAKINLCRGY